MVVEQEPRPVGLGGIVKRARGSAVATAVLALGVWVFFYIEHPSAPLTAGETLVVVAVSWVIVSLVRWAWKRIRKRV